jgi:hypothetical protein
MRRNAGWRGLVKLAAATLGAMLTVAIVVALLPHGLVAHDAASLVTPPVLAVGMIAPAVVARTWTELNAIANPAEARQGEAIPFILYDSQPYVSAVTTILTFFQGTQVDRTLSNLQTAGQLPDPQWLEIHNLGFDILIDATETAAETGSLDDIAKLMLVGRPIFTLSLSDKAYGPFPLSFLHTSGGPVGALATGTADTIQVGNNGISDGGWNWRGSVVIPPKVGFNVQVQWAAAQTIVNDGAFLRFWMAGALQRRVL